MRSFVVFGHLRPQLVRATALACGWAAHDLTPSTLRRAGLPPRGLALRHPDSPYDVIVLTAPPTLTGVGRWETSPEQDTVHDVALDSRVFDEEVADAPVAASLIQPLRGYSASAASSRSRMRPRAAS